MIVQSLKVIHSVKTCTAKLLVVVLLVHDIPNTINFASWCVIDCGSGSIVSGDQIEICIQPVILINQLNQGHIR